MLTGRHERVYDQLECLNGGIVFKGSVRVEAREGREHLCEKP